MTYLKASVTSTVINNNIPKLISSLKLVIFLCIINWFLPAFANASTTQDNTFIVQGKSTLNNTRQIAQLEVTPERCIALRKGQKCYLEVTFSWQHPQISDYCLVNTTTNKTIKCWQQQAKGKFNFDFQSTLTNDFALRKPKSTVNLAQATIPVAWVYKSSKRAKATWRLF